MMYQQMFHAFSQGQGWNIADLAFSKLTNILSVAPQSYKYVNFESWLVRHCQPSLLWCNISGGS